MSKKREGRNWEVINHNIITSHAYQSAQKNIVQVLLLAKEAGAMYMHTMWQT